MRVFFELHQVPAHSVLLLDTREEALRYPRGDIRLGFCSACGFISNVAFNPALQEYSEKYEATQGYSPTFNSFHHRLAMTLIERYDLHSKRILEIGCGQGEFLSLLCGLGSNQGIGFDPAYAPSRISYQQPSGAVFVQDFYSEKYAGNDADFICCKMTLEHIHDTAGFMRKVRLSLGDQSTSIVFFQVPNVRYMLSERAYWDVYYEHCSYFSPGSLARLFRKTGFDVTDLWTDYESQYLMIEARPGIGSTAEPLPQEDSPTQLVEDVDRFVAGYSEELDAWRRRLKLYGESGKRVVLWGGGSKGVSFLTALDASYRQIEYVVDVNPHKVGTYMAGTGQEIVPPNFLKRYRPDVVIVMNPIYLQEILQMLQDMQLSPELLPASGERKRMVL